MVRGSAVAKFGEDEARATPTQVVQSEVVHNSANDRDAHSALAASQAGYVFAFRVVNLIDVEPGAVIPNLDDRAVSVYRERKVHLPIVVAAGMQYEHQAEGGDSDS